MTSIERYIWAFAVVMVGFTTWHVDNKFWEAKQAAALQTEIDQHQKDQQAANDHAADLEKDLAAERLKGITLNQQLEKANGKIVNNCPVPSATIRLLNAAIAK